MIEKRKNWLFRSKVAEFNPDVEVLGDYIDCKTKVELQCKKCGLKYFDTVQEIYSGRLHIKSVCDKNIECKFCSSSYHKKSEQKKIISKLNHIASSICDLDFIEPYNPISQLIKCQCKTCGYVFEESLDNLYANKYFCNNCLQVDRNKYDKTNSNREMKLNQLFKNSHHINFKSKSGSKIECYCDMCGNDFEIIGYTKRKKITCPYCYEGERNAVKRGRRLEERQSEYTSIRRKCDYISYCYRCNDYLCGECKIQSEPYYTKKEFQDIVEKSNRYIELCENYIDLQTKISYRCKKCGSVYYAKPRNLLMGSCGCKKCRQSKGEIVISSYLDEHHIEYESEKIFNDCTDIRVLRFDFYIPSFNTVIEYDGKQHFEPVEYFGGKSEFLKLQNRDKIKEKYCKANGIKLIRISYYCKDIYAELNKYFAHG